jgi:hypothetical protein
MSGRSSGMIASENECIDDKPQWWCCYLVMSEW